MEDGKPRGPWLSLLQPPSLLFLLLFLLTFWLRCPRLAERPMHNDEAVNAIKFGQLWEGAGYKYDPNEHHGPTLYYGTLALSKLTGAPDFQHFTETRLRLLTVLCGAGLVLFLPLLFDGLGCRAMLWAALLTAVSPAMVFYSRYYIHEMLLVLFSLLAIAAGWRYWRTRRIGWALLSGAGLGLMYATKETFPLTVAAGAAALGLNQFWNRRLDASGLPVRAPRLNYWHLAAAAGIGLLIGVVLFSSFLSNFPGVLDSVRTYRAWLRRAGGDSAHIHAWNFYFERLLWFHQPRGPFWTEAIILALALLGGAASFCRKGLGDANASFGRFLALYTCLLTAAYTFIAYKTPWCALNFWHGAILLGGLGAAVLIRSAKQLGRRIAWAVLVLAGAAHLGWQAVRASQSYAADPRNPYVYAQTSPDILNLAQILQSLAAAQPDGHQMPIKVMAPENDYWPLPWYLRQFTRTGWWDRIPAEPFAPVMIVSAKFRAGLDEQKTHLMVHYYALRPQVLFELYVQTDLWRAYLAKNPPRPDSD